MIMRILHGLIRFFIGYLITIGSIFGTQWTYYNYLDAYQLPVITEPIPILNENNEIAIGEIIEMQLNIYKPENISPIDSSVNITCEDGNLVTLTSSSAAGTIPTGEFTFVSNSYELPAKVSAGDRCMFNYVNTYQPNPYKTETIVWSSEVFEVVE